MSDVRPLPARPSLEYVRKEAKSLLRLLKAGDPGTRARAISRHHAFASRAFDTFKLADAQLVLAREYGFASWPKLVRYFGEAERLLLRTPSPVNGGLFTSEAYTRVVRDVLARHERRSLSAARTLVAYVPRFYGLSHEEAFELPLSEHEAQLAVAREHGFVSWDAFMATVQASSAHPLRREQVELAPHRQAINAIAAADVDALERIVATHPELRSPSDFEVATACHLMVFALQREAQDMVEQRDPARLRPIFDWLETIGFDRQLTLNQLLCGGHHMRANDVQSLIERGADPNWVAPNGYSVLEHAIIRYWRGDTIDTLAQYATVRRPGFWVAAGLGDVHGMARFFDRRGRLTDSVREFRPPFDVIGPTAIVVAPDADDEELLAETAVVAFLAERANAVEYLVQRGFAVDSLRWGMPFAAMAAGNKKVALLEALVRCGANLDLAGHSNGSAREMAREHIRSLRVDDTTRRIAELCGLDVNAIVAEREAEPVPAPVHSERLQRVLRLAADDASRVGSPVISQEHLLFGLLRSGWPAVRALIDESGLDREAFKETWGSRVQRGDEVSEGGPMLPLSTNAVVSMQAATTWAAERRREQVSPHHLLAALLRSPDGAAARLVQQFGGSASKALEFVERLG